MVNQIPESYSYLDHDGSDTGGIKLVATARLPSEFGDFIILGFENFPDQREHTVIVKGDIVGKSDVLTRVHSECLTGEVLGSKRCDCRAQLHMALEEIEKNGTGILIYLRQEGRGIGLTNKLRAYQLQDGGLNTMEANRALGFDDDERSFDIVRKILSVLQVKSIRLMTNNPKKLKDIRHLGVKIVERVEIITETNEFNREYLTTKLKMSDHLLEPGMDASEYLGPE